MNRKVKLAACTALTLAAHHCTNKTSRIRKCKTNSLNRDRKSQGFYIVTFLPVKNSDPKRFFELTRMSAAAFDKLVLILADKLQKRSLSDSVSPSERIAVTLQFLIGSKMKQAAAAYRLGTSTVQKIIIEVCGTIHDILSPIYLKPPATAEDWENICRDFFIKFDFPNCVGALDAKIVKYLPTQHSADVNHTIIILAACDANHKFTLTDIIVNSTDNDLGILKNSKFNDDKLILPHNTMIEPFSPYVFVANGNFPLKSYIMRPFPDKNPNDFDKQLFNERIKVPRSAIENTFGVMVTRWKILQQDICAKVDNVELFLKAIICLHNYAMTECPELYCPAEFAGVNGEVGKWRLEESPLESVGRLASNNSSRNTIGVRDSLMNYFVSQSKVSSPV